MKFAIIAELTVDTPAQNENMDKAVKANIAGKPTWGSVIVTKGFDDKIQKPTNQVEVRFENKADAIDLFDLHKDKMIKIPVLKGVVSWHECLHDGTPKPCVISEQFIKE